MFARILEGARFFQKAPDGSLLTVAEQDLGNKVLSRFTPGDPLIIPGMNPGESRKSTVQVSVYNLSDSKMKSVTHSGSLDVTYTYVGTYRVTVPPVLTTPPSSNGTMRARSGRPPSRIRSTVFWLPAPAWWR